MPDAIRVINSVTVVPRKNMQILYRDSAALPTMNKEELIRILKLQYLLTKFWKNCYVR